MRLENLNAALTTADMPSVNAVTLATDEKSQAVVAEITLGDLRSLITGEVLVLKCPRFYPADVCAVVAERLLNHPLGGITRMRRRSAEWAWHTSKPLTITPRTATTRRRPMR